MTDAQLLTNGNRYYSTLNVRQLGLCAWQTTASAMRNFTLQRQVTTVDELWLTEHPALFTQGRAGRTEHLLAPGDIPVLQSDRGGQVTYHGPGQQIAYLLIDLKRRELSIRRFVNIMESSVIHLLEQLGIAAYASADAPGVYVGAAKICSLGLRIKKGCTTHGLALNVNMDLRPFLRINPCGYPALRMTQIAQFEPRITLQYVQQNLVEAFASRMNYNKLHWFDGLPS